jgi:hypothetical protein
MEQQRVVFGYERDPAYRVIYANGAQGGMTPKGEYTFDLFFEHARPPTRVVHSITPDGLGPEVERTPPSPQVMRDLLVGVVMTPAGAKSLAHWILESIRQFEEKTSRPSN